MILSFDKFERYELPQVTLCNPNSRATEVDGKITITDTVGVLSNPKGMNLKLNFNAPHELSFDYYKHKSADPIKQSFYDSIYESIQTDRYIYLTDIGYFIISSVTDSDEDNIDKKSISLKSCEENELATAEGLHLKEGTYYLHTDNNDGLLDLFLPKTAGWTMGYIDPSLLTKPYFVEDTEVDNGYNFLYTTIQDMYECIVEPDIIKRTINVYSRVYYAEHHLTDIHIAKYNLLKHKTVEENDEDKYTALNVQGKDENLEIRTVNPTGKNVIYNFEPRYSWMSPALQTAVTKWQEKCESVEEEYLTLQQGYYDDMGNIVFPLEKDIETLELQLKEQEQTRDFIVRDDYDKKKYGEVQKDALDAINREIKTTQSQLKSKKEDLEVEKKNVQNNYLQHIDQINLDCALDITAIDINGNSIFTTDLLNELMTHIKPTDYVDEYMLVTESMTYPQKFEKAKELMDRAQSQLVKISSGQKTYSIDTRSFLFNKQFKHFSEQLCAGAIIYVETKNDIMEQLHLTGIDINFDEKSTNFTLGNKYDRSDLKALYEDALGQNSKSFSELKYIAGIIEDQQKQLDYQRNWVADLRTLTLDNVLTSEDQAIEINNRGLIGRKRRLDENGNWDFDENGNPYFEAEQVKLINNTLVFTENNWRTASTAVGKIAVGYDAEGNVKYAYGINGQVLIGELILGNNLVLTGTGAGIKIKDSNGKNAFYADENGNLVLSGTIYAKKGEIAGWTIDDVKLYSGQTGLSSSTFAGDPSFWAGYCGNSITGTPWQDTNWQNNTLFYVTNEGYVKASRGTIGGWIIGRTDIYAPNGSSLVGMNSESTRWAFYAGETNLQYGQSQSNATFKVGHNGHLYATNAYISGDSTFSGTITATGTVTGTINADWGRIGGWTIDGSGLYYQNGNSGCGLYGHQNHANIAIHAGANQSNIGGAPFRVYHDGSLVATNATITGTLSAGSKLGSNAITIEDYSHVGGCIRSSNSKTKITISNSFLLLGFYNNVNSDNSIMIDKDYVSLRGNVIGMASEQVLSDESHKNSFIAFSDDYNTFFDALNPTLYKYNDGTSDRYHSGFVAQGVNAALKQANIDTKNFAGLCIANSGQDNETWYIRYDEFIALNTWQIQRCKKRIADLENTVAELKTQIQILTAG